MPQRDPVAAQVEGLLLRYGCEQSRPRRDGDVPLPPEQDLPGLEPFATIVFDEPIPFTRESWRGYVLTRDDLRNQLTNDRLRALDHEHAVLLQSLTRETFTVRHRVCVRLLRPTAPA